MKTTKTTPMTSYSYGITLEELIKKFEEMKKQKIIKHYALINHKPTEDIKEHIHILITTNKTIKEMNKYRKELNTTMFDKEYNVEKYIMWAMESEDLKEAYSDENGYYSQYKVK